MYCPHINIFSPVSQLASHFYLRRSHAGQWIIIGSLLNFIELLDIEATKPWVHSVIMVKQFKFKVRSDLRGRLEAAMSSEAVGGNMHMDTRVIKVADVKYVVI